MLNSYSVTPKVDARTTNCYELNINAVSGTLCKSHLKSIFVWVQRGSAWQEKLMCAEPKFRFNFDKKQNVWTKKMEYANDEEPAVVLQAMLTAEDRVLVEVVQASDFYEEVVDDNS